MATLLYDTGVYGDTYGEAAAEAVVTALRIRERPPLRLSHDIEASSGKHYRWAEDEPRAENIPSSVQFSDTMPGGFENGGAVLPRKPGIVYSDLEPLSTWTMYGSGGEIAWQGRLERAPRTSGEQMAVSPSAVGWQAHLEDDKSVQAIYVDQDLSRWQGPSVQRKLNLVGSYTAFDPSVVPDVTTGQPSLATSFTSDWIASSKPTAEGMYDANGVPLGSLYFAWKKNGANVNEFDGSWYWQTILADSDTYPSVDSSGNLIAAGPGTGTLTATTATRTFAAAHLSYNSGPAGSTNTEYAIYWTCLAVYGSHGLTKRGTASATAAQGFYASDIVGHAVGAWAPLLTIGSDSIQPSSFVIPHLAFLEPTTVGEIVRQATRFGLEDWAVWDDKEFVWHQRGAKGRKWRARISPSQLEETGQDVARLFESVVVEYQDVTGSNRTVGPPGSGADAEDSTLKDSDSENPANKLGITKRALLQMGVATVASATEVGRRFLEEQKLIDRSGRAQLVGHVQDDRGVWHPYWKVRAGDYISFVDSSDTSYRRIVKTDKTHSERACSVDLDAPPEGLQALLERLGVVLVPLGL